MIRRLLAALAVLLAIGLAADAAKKPRKPKGPREMPHDVVAGGDHWRLKTAHGPVHVWRPRGHKLATAGVVVYVHGYYDSVDTAWTKHGLAEQFRASRHNAIFIAPEAPAGNEEPVRWESLADLLTEVRKQTRIKLGGGPLVAAAHSGGFRTVARWLVHPRLAHILLLDGLYSAEQDFRAWLDGGPRRRLTLIATDTLPRCESFLKGYRRAVRRSSFPDDGGFAKKERQARLLLIKSQHGHMEIVTGGKVIPAVLRLSPLKRL